ncbi:MAG: uracil-DNA glycosylase [Hyphomicrobiales bacterium]
MQSDSQSNIDHLNRAELLDILSWYVDAGVDEAITDESVNHFAELAPIPKLAETPKAAITPAQNQTPFANSHTANNPYAPPVPRPKAAPKPSANKTRMAKDLKAGQVDYQHSIKSAQKLAASCESLDALGKALQGFEECSLKHTAKHLIFGQGNQSADILIVGESPTRDEDLIGHAFAGASGQMLDNILKAIKLDRDKVWLSYLLPWRTLGGAPSQANIDICQPFLMRQIELVNPKIIITLDGLVFKTLTKQTDRFISARGKFTETKVADKTYKTIPTFHPQLLLQNAGYKQLVWQDFLSAVTS